MVTQQIDAPSALEIRALRQEMMLTLEDFASVVGCAYYTVYRWESRKTPDISGKNSDALNRVLNAWRRMSVSERLRLISIKDKTQRRVEMRAALNSKG